MALPSPASTSCRPRAPSPRARVNVVPDLPGYGRSERRDHVLDISALARALLAILDALDIDKAVLVGNSMGCPIGLEVAHEAPERVHSLVLVSPAGGAHNQPLRRALGQLATDALRESPRMVPVALPDYLRFGPLERPAPVSRADPLPLAGAPGGHARPDTGRPWWPRPAHAVTGPRPRGRPARSRAPDGRARREGGARGELQPPRRAGGRDRSLARRCWPRRHPLPSECGWSSRVATPTDHAALQLAHRDPAPDGRCATRVWWGALPVRSSVRPPRAGRLGGHRCRWSTRI